MEALRARLDQEWRQVLRSEGARSEAGRLCRAEPELRRPPGCPGPGEPAACLATAVAGACWRGYRPSDQTAQLLSALLRQAGSALAARALLQAMLPRLSAENVYTPTYGHGLEEHWQSTQDTAADLVAECFAAIKRHAGEDRETVDRLLVREAARRLRTARQARYRDLTRTAPLDVATAPPVRRDDRSAAEQLAQVLVQAVQVGRLARADASLLYAARVKGMPASEVGRCHGLAERAVYYALSRAERCLVSGAA